MINDYVAVFFFIPVVYITRRYFLDDDRNFNLVLTFSKDECIRTRYFYLVDELNYL